MRGSLSIEVEKEVLRLRQNRQQSYLFSFIGVVMRVNEDDWQLQAKIISLDAMKNCLKHFVSTIGCKEKLKN